MWQKDGRKRWVLDAGSLNGEAVVREVEGGYKAVVTVTDEDFGMSFVDEEEFFESESAAVAFVRERMDESV